MILFGKFEINLDNFIDKLKYDPEDFIKVKAIQGDKSDNIPGIKGFGKVKIGKVFRWYSKTYRRRK